jgi:cytidylate kinase
VAPLRPAEDAVLIDTTGLSIDEVVERVLAIVKS